MVLTLVKLAAERVASPVRMQQRGAGPRGTIPVSIADRMISGQYRIVDVTDRVDADPTDVVTALPMAETEPVTGRALDDDVPSEAQRLGSIAQPKAQAQVARVPSKEATPHELSPGDTFRGYTIVRFFDEGGLSILYEATHPRLTKPVLIKLLKPAYRRRESIIIQAKLIAEGRLLLSAEGKNPHLVRCHEVGVDEKLGPFIVIERLQGKTLYEHISNHLAKGRTFEPDAAVKLAITLCYALHRMHQLGAVHRDIKPANVFLVEEDGVVVGVVILDWGAAKSSYAPDTSLESDTLGTIAYMPPEMITRVGAITGAVDQYALAFMVLEMLFRHPFRGKSEVNTFTLMNAHLAESVEQPPLSFVPARLWEILKRAVEKDRAARFLSCAAFGDALRAWLENPDQRVKSKPLSEKILLPTVPKSGQTKGGRTPLQPIVQAAQKAPRVPMTKLAELPSVVVRSGGQAGERYLVEGGIVIGRHEDYCNIVLHDAGISKRHARIEGVAYGTNLVFTLIDLESQNGTSAGGVRLSDGVSFEDHLPAAGILVAGSTFVLDTIELVLMPAGRAGADGAWQSPAEATAEDAARAAAALAQPSAPAARARTEPDVKPPPKPKAKKLRQAPQFTPQMNVLVPTLLVTKDKEIRRYLLDVSGIIGTSAERSNITIADPRVSGAHCRFTQTLGGFGADVTYLFEDLGSTNGMWTDPHDARGQVQAVALKSGESVHLGRSVELMLLAPGRFDADWRYHLCDERGRPLWEEPAEQAPATTAERPRRSPARLAGPVTKYVALVTAAMLLAASTVYALFHLGILGRAQ